MYLQNKIVYIVVFCLMFLQLSDIQAITPPPPSQSLNSPVSFDAETNTAEGDREPASPSVVSYGLNSVSGGNGQAGNQSQPWPRRVLVKTNAPAWGMLISNVAAEIDLDPHWSLNLPVYYSALNYFTSTIKFRTFSLQPEVRYWFSEENEGWFVGAHLGMAYFNFATDGAYRTQDHKGHSPAFGGGIAGGYRMPLSANKRWKIEFSLGAGVYSLYYDRFRNRHNGLLVDTKRKAYLGIDQVPISFVYTFYLKKKGGVR